jgi:hypothetical protein
MLPKQVISYKQLLAEGIDKGGIRAMSASLRIFPTPFKGIYYIPLEIERKGWFMEKPLMVLTRAIGLFLGSRDFYYSCATAEEFWGIRWRPSGKVHIVNEVASLRINLKERIARNMGKNTYRAKKIAAILSFYGEELVFHKTKSVKGCMVKQTPIGSFASISQIKKDRKKFRCK